MDSMMIIWKQELWLRLRVGRQTRGYWRDEQLLDCVGVCGSKALHHVWYTRVFKFSATAKYEYLFVYVAACLSKPALEGLLCSDLGLHQTATGFLQHHNLTKLRGLSPRGNYTDRQPLVCEANFCG
jgi:hypothetical protein